MLQRGGRVHSRHIERVTADNLKVVLDEVADKGAHLMTDTGVLWGKSTGRKHSLVNHKADEYVRFDEGVMVRTNAVEGCFSILKRGINGVYHHVGRKHLHRYLSEFDFRYDERKVTDGQRAQTGLKRFLRVSGSPIRGLTAKPEEPWKQKGWVRRRAAKK